MKKSLVLAFIASLLAIAPAWTPAAAQTKTAPAASASEEYTVDPVHSSANFSVKHLMVSNVRGRFSDLKGTIVYNEADPAKSSVVATIRVASVNTDNEKRDTHLRSADFFETEKYPEMRFESTKVERAGDQWKVTGNLTLKGVTRQVVLPFTVAKGEVGGKTRLGVETELTLNRFDYNVSYDSTGAAISKEVKVVINLEAVRNETAAPSKITAK